MRDFLGVLLAVCFIGATALVGIMVGIAVKGRGNHPSPQPYYATPSQYEREHGEPDRVCKWWGDGNSVYERAKRLECTVKGGE